MAIDFSFPPEIDELRFKVRALHRRGGAARRGAHRGTRERPPLPHPVDHRDARRRQGLGTMAAAHAEGARRHGARPRGHGGGVGGSSQVGVRAVRTERAGARRGQHAHPAALGQRRAEGEVPAAAVRGCRALVLRDDRARGRRLRSDAHSNARRARRRRLGRSTGTSGSSPAPAAPSSPSSSRAPRTTRRFRRRRTRRSSSICRRRDGTSCATS